MTIEELEEELAKVDEELFRTPDIARKVELAQIKVELENEINLKVALNYDP